MSGQLKLRENAEYFFDAVAADRVVRFIETFCRHYEGRHAGKPFLLHEVQKQIIRDIYGWKSRATGFRRFTDVYLEGAVGAGKSPLLAALGLFGLCADGEAGAQIYSCSSSYTQSLAVFDCAKQFIGQSRELEKRLVKSQFMIRHPRSRSFWRIVSSKGPGAGAKPSLILADELHDWQSRGSYDALQSRMNKRTQPLCICATNAGEERTSFCWQLHEAAIACLAGKGPPTLYPVIWRADPDDDTQTAPEDSPASWRAANPLMGVTITEEKIAAEYEKSRTDATMLARFRRLYLTRWVKQGAKKWLNLALWDAATGEFDPSTLPKDSGVYFGGDLSMDDDLSAIVDVFVTRKKTYVRSHFYLPLVTAQRYDQAKGSSYQKWAEQGFITLVPEPTISPEVKRQIAARIHATAATAKRSKIAVKGFFYDRARADDCVAALEAGGKDPAGVEWPPIPCIPVGQGWGVSNGCQELDRRLKEGSIQIAANPVLRMCAENVEIKEDGRGNYWPVKPNAKGRYAGKREKKIDGISALVTALTESRKHSFPRPPTGVKAYNPIEG